MRRRGRRRGFSKEWFIMVASSVLVLASLTATGLWLGRSDDDQGEDYVVDLSAIENNTAARLVEGSGASEGVLQDVAAGDDLDYDPYFQETNSQNVENPDQSGSKSMSEGAENAGSNSVFSKNDNAADENASAAESDTQQDGTDQSGQASADTPDQTSTPQSAGSSASPAAAGTANSSEKEDDDAKETMDTTAVSTAMQPALTFGDSDALVWPIVGNVLINYSMDKTIYFPTLQQYKYNPAIVIAANEGDLISAAAAGKVISVFKDPQIGNGVIMELGGGYEVTYGQLENILVSEGSYVAMGDVIAQVAAPTKYYSVEGTNVYFKLTKNGVPVNPMSKLSEG